MLKSLIVNFGIVLEVIYTMPLSYSIIYLLSRDTYHGLLSKGNMCDTKIIEKHEKGHAENALYQGVHGVRNDRNKDKSKILLRGLMSNFRVRSLKSHLTDKFIQQLQMTGEADLEKLRNSIEYRQILHFALDFAKGEILAEYKSLAFTSVRQKLFDLLRRNGIYDYFNNIFSLMNYDTIHDALWDDYERILKEQTSNAQVIVSTYNVWGLHERAELFRWVLAQFQLSQWDDQLRSSKFVEEAVLLEALFKRLYSSHEKSEKQVRSCLILKEDLIETFRNKQDLPLFQYIEAANKEIDKIMQDRGTEDSENV
ncbi:MAG: hypothetical protein UX30_C0012G0007 [Candidatus Saccharibacteria bacterium GW2011_GWA2_46_10]|nr:MAG: hypothetical protein UX30_C0012G0007 [Candidatus Saccharibacteria bacterium GW2011_GWA2_46_10]